LPEEGIIMGNQRTMLLASNVEQPATPDAVQRLFFAVLLPPEVRAAVAAAGQPLEEVGQELRWARPEALHLTLCFLGACGPDRAAAAHGVGAEAAAGVGPFEVTLGGLGVFPTLARPTVVWVGVVGGARELTTLHTRLATLDEGAGAARFAAHVTVARVQQRANRGARAAIGRAVAGAPHRVYGRFVATHLALMRSELGNAGPRYTPVASFALSGLPSVGLHEGRPG